MFFQYDMGDESFQKSISFSKTKQTSFLPFWITNAGDFTCDEKYYTRREGLEACLLLYTLEGAGIVEYEGNQILVSPGQAIVLDCRKFHFYATHGDRWRFWWIHFEGKCAYDYVELLNEEGADAAVHIEKKDILEYYETIKSSADRFDVKKELELSLTMQSILTFLINKKKTEGFSSRYGAYQKELEYSIDYIQEHFAEKISVEQLADICHLSKYYYIKVFKSYLGQTPYDYLLNVRIQRAKHSLLESSKSIEEISQECGFSESKNFIASFRQKVGITPLQFRKQNITSAP